MGNTLTVKLISMVSTIGSQESTARRLTKLSAAAGKFNLTIGTSIKLALKKTVTEGPTGQPPRTEKTKPSNTKVVTKTIEDCSPEDATLIADYLFNLMDAQSNTASYEQAKAHFDTCKRQVLAEFGAQNYDVLTAEERKSYATKMIALGAPFKFTTQSIHIKYGDNQTIYSRTRRVSGTSHWNEDFFDSKVDIKKLREKYQVTFRQPVESGSQSQTTAGTDN